MWLSDLQIVLPDRVLENGSLRIEAGRIAEIVEGPVSHAKVRAPGLTALPGLIDLHGDMLEREISPRPKANIPIDLALHELDKRLVATGITTAYAAVSFAWHRSDSIRSEARAREIMLTVNELRPHLLADHLVHARFEITNPDAGQVLTALLNDRQVHLVSIMDHTPGQGQYRDIEAYIKFAVEWSKRTGETYGKTEEEVRAQVAERQRWPKGWDVVRDVAQIAKRYGVPLASHDDDTVEKVDWVHEIGVTISEFPVTEEAAAEAKRRGLHVAMGAPNALQGRSLSGNLSAADAVAAGLVDTLATDYYPASMLHAMHAFVERGVLPLHQASKIVSENPAAALGLYDRGQLAVDKNADIVLVDLRQRPRVHGVIRNGDPVYWDLYMARCGTLPVSEHVLEAL